MVNVMLLRRLKMKFKRNYTVTEYYRNGDVVNRYPIGVKEESDCMDATMRALVHDDIKFFTYKYDELDENGDIIHNTSFVTKDTVYYGKNGDYIGKVLIFNEKVQKQR